MAAVFPNGVVQLTPKMGGEPNKVYATEYNKLQDEIMAIEGELLKPISQQTKINAANSAKLGGVSASNFVQGTSWQSWTPIQTGWTGLPSGAYRWCRIGNTVTCIVHMSGGTSNSASASISLPVAAANNSVSVRGALGYHVDNGVTQTAPGTWVINSGSSVVTFYRTYPEGGWTASGTKMVIATFTYECVP